MSWRVTFEIYGEDFKPNEVDFNFSEKNEPNDICRVGRLKGEPYKYGSASYQVPKYIDRDLLFKHLADTFEPMLDELKCAGAESWHIEIDRLYYAQCNEELSPDEITQIARLKCSVSYSAYAVSEEEEIKGFK
ncbi:hypothetical protein [Bernardetia sp.]|uniref:hypothetical protein n=1 Tax=Bernardetia sp. TaxID=1937974 RepID=UPI0025C03046|nr:hypothetical protein [Bernardetia sp.]